MGVSDITSQGNGLIGQQKATDAAEEALTMASQMEAARHDTMMSILRNIK